MAESEGGCVEPAGGPILPRAERETAAVDNEEGLKMTATVGKPAPDFEASAFIDGGFKNVKLSDYREQWVVLCFYPGDFTFV